jgi:hypothetical protein
MDPLDDKRKLHEIIDTYGCAFEMADADLMTRLFWIDDPRFSEVENDRAQPFGRETFLTITDWIRENARPGGKMRFYDTTVHLLSPHVAYAVSMRDEYENGQAIPSRVTLVFLKKGDDWKIIHGHFSHVPES